MIAIDIKKKKKKDFKEEDRYVVEIIFRGIYSKETKYYTRDQICRSILFLAGGDINNLISFLKMLKVDSRDVIDAAELKAGCPGHYFAIPFPEIESFIEKVYREEEPPSDLWLD
ncbi:MAG: hypothetical protein MI974_13850 [Chitinophagales bacterium]|nr:hypothetical protein [Chitinophagales bacterium]